MSDYLFSQITKFIKSHFPHEEFIPLHAPVFIGNEKKYVLDAIDSTYVSSVGPYVNRFEEMMVDLTGADHAIAIVNGTNALHMGLILAGVNRGDEVLSQALTFVATANAISYIGAEPVFIDVDGDSFGMSPESLRSFLNGHAVRRTEGTYNKSTGCKISACVPMHTFGMPCRIDEIAEICDNWNISLIEDSAESIGSFFKGRHTGVFGKIGIFSFNGNKTVTCGGGGALITNDPQIAKHAKHLTTQAKVPHQWNFVHDHIGYNYRMPNLNAALAVAQLEQLDTFIENKRRLAAEYSLFFKDLDIPMQKDMDDTKSNYWLNAIVLKDIDQRDAFLEYSNSHGVMTRPIWELMNKLPMFRHCQTDSLENSRYLAERVVNIPSGYRPD
ncbi:LegC family aminotransferase [Pedobacter deserti]|uniref:LegC family aminotransferase n=1 Tax=Pedobacter deserti TaxID=2817382 RepID=UPI00210DCBC2|nr:LegC family aminotransferase [Pedobacter sp. SYSU D00382]